MTSARGIFFVLVAAWIAGVLATRWVMLGAFALDGPTLALMAAVPLTQAVVFLAWRAIRRRP
ncbi:MAG: hypothetical protein AB7L71_02720 [Vicinamibacterales bacterium]|jgi:hypothetical protein